jgi:hypothetical protein
MTSWNTLARAPGLGISLKAGAAVLTLVLVLAFTLTNAEASGDEYGDGVSITGEVDGTPTDVTGPTDLDFVQIGTADGGGSVTVEFQDNVAFDGAGADIRVNTVDALLPAVATIEVSADGVTFVSAGDFSDDAGSIDIDLGALDLSFASAVRITHVSGDLPGFDLESIEALNQIDLEDVTVVLDPTDAENPGFTEHLVTATVDDGAPAIGILVSFAIVSGPNDDTAVVATDELGAAPFAWIGDGGLGIDELEAWIDIDGSGTREGGEPFATATKQWHGVTGTIELVDLDAGGLVVGDIVHVIVDDRDLDTSDDPDTVEVIVTSTSDPVGITVVLTETGSHTGIFSGLVELGETSDEGAGVLAAASGDDVTGTYDDELDGEGNDPEAVSAAIAVGDTEEEGTRVTVCHRPPGNPGNQKTLTIGSSALAAHLGHGDAVGECGEPIALTKQEEAMEAKAERDEQRAEDRAQREADREAAAVQRDEDRANRAAERDAARLQREEDRAQRAADRESRLRGPQR